MGVIQDAANTTYADGPVDDPYEPPKSEVRALFGVVEQQVTAAAAGVTVKTTWSDLSAISGTRDGQQGRVTGTDAGTHTDPVAGGTVDNVGECAWSVSPAGWERVSDLQDAEAVTAEVEAARGGEDTLSDALGLKANASTVTALSDEVDLKAPLDSPLFTGNPGCPDPTAGTGIANKRYVDTALLAQGFVGFFDNGDALPDPVEYPIGTRITIADGNDMILCVRSQFQYWQPVQNFRPTWLPLDADYGVSFDRNRYFRDGVGYLPLTYIVTTSRTGDAYARKKNGYWKKFGDNEIRCTDLGLWSETSPARATNFLRYSNDYRINVGIQMTGGSGDFQDGELVTWADGGSGTLVLDQSDLANHIYAFRNANGGPYTGTATGHDSGATRTFTSTTLRPGWTISGITVERDQLGFDETANGGCTLTATTNGATISQAVMSSAFASPQTADSYYNVNIGIQRINGTGDVQLSMDDGATYSDPLDFDGTGLAWVQVDPAQLFATGATVKLRMATSGDAIYSPFIQFEVKKTRSSYIPTTWNTGIRLEDNYTAAIDAFQNMFTSGEFSYVVRVRTMEKVTGAFFQIDDQPDRTDTAALADNRYRHDFAYKPDREDPPGTPAPGIEVGVTCGVDGSTTAGIDPVGYLLPVDEEAWLGWSLDFANLTIVSAGGGIATSSTRPSGTLADPADMVSIRWGSDCGASVPLNGYIRTWVGYKSVKDVSDFEALTGGSSPIALP